MDVSAGAIVFYREGDKIEFLLLKYKNYWGFPKGLVEKGESLIQTALREIKEETGLDVELLPLFKEEVEFFFRWEGKMKKKKVIYFLGEAKKKDVKISSEHYGYKWLSFKDAWDLVKIKSHRKILDKAKDYLERFKGS